MLLTTLLLNLVFLSLTAGADAKTSPKEGWEDLVKRLELRLRELETRMEDENERKAQAMKELEEAMEMRLEAEKKEMKARLEAKDEEMESRLEELEEKMKKEKEESEVSMSKLEESLRKEMASNCSKNALAEPSPRDLPIILIFAWRGADQNSHGTVTFESFLANFNNGNRPGGGSGELDLDSGVFTCFTPGYYTVSFSAHSAVDSVDPYLYLYKNAIQLPESSWYLFGSENLKYFDNIGATSSRILVRNSLNFLLNDVYHVFPQILHMDEGDILELRLTEGSFIRHVTFNIELVGLGYD